MSTFTRKVSDLVAEDFNFGLSTEDYPIFDETYRDGLNRKLIRHYWNYEIGQETEAMFHFSLNRKMNEIMPLYNQLYLSTRITFDPMKTIDYTDSTNTTDATTGERTDSSTNTGTGDSKARSVNSEAPQVMLSGNEDYASGAVDTISESITGGTGSSTASHSDSATGSIDRSVTGFQGVVTSDLLMAYRATLLNIDMQVIGELETLFMQIWDNGDEYSSPGLIGVYGYGFSAFNFGIL